MASFNDIIVYGLFDKADGVCLYVGKTGDRKSREAAHRYRTNKSCGSANIPKTIDWDMLELERTPAPFINKREQVWYDKYSAIGQAKYNKIRPGAYDIGFPDLVTINIALFQHLYPNNIYYSNFDDKLGWWKLFSSENLIKEKGEKVHFMTLYDRLNRWERATSCQFLTGPGVLYDFMYRYFSHLTVPGNMMIHTTYLGIRLIDQEEPIDPNTNSILTDKFMLDYARSQTQSCKYSRYTVDGF